MRQYRIAVDGRKYLIKQDDMDAIIATYACRYSNESAIGKNIIAKYIIALNMCYIHSAVQRVRIDDRVTMLTRFEMCVVTALNSFNASKGVKFQTWLSWQLKGALSKYWWQVTNTRPTDELVDVAQEAEVSYLLHERLMKVAKEILKPKDYTLFSMYHVYDFSLADVGSIHGISRQAVDQKLRSIRARLKAACISKGYGVEWN